jgi:hypothetical protein
MLKKSYLRTLIVFLGGLAATVLHAQTTQIAGQVVDQSKGSVSGAEIKLTRTTTGEVLHTTTTEQGYYSFPSLLPRNYSLTVDKLGFGTVSRTGIVVETAQTSSVDVTLSVGAVNQSVTVSEELPQLQTQTAAVGNEVENKTIMGLQQQPCGNLL